MFWKVSIALLLAGCLTLNVIVAFRVERTDELVRTVRDRLLLAPFGDRSEVAVSMQPRVTLTGSFECLVSGAVTIKSASVSYDPVQTEVSQANEWLNEELAELRKDCDG